MGLYLWKNNGPKIKATPDVSFQESNNQLLVHCPEYDATASASLMLLISQGGDDVTGDAKWQYVQVMSTRYHNSDRKTKCLILSELEINLKIHRKSAIRQMSEVKNKRPKENRGRRRIYNDFVVQHLKKFG